MGKLTKKNKAFMLMILGIILLVGGIAVSISLGAKNIDINTILRSILSDGNDINSKIIRDVRIPRALAAVLVGGFLAVSGAIMQGITRNPRAGRKVDPVKLALAGTAMGTLLISLAMGTSMYFNLSQELSFWIAGGLTSAKWQGVNLLLIVGSVGLIGAIIMAPKITILSLGEEVAIGLGQRTNLVRFISLIIVILLTGASVSVAGNVVFVGLIVPQIIRGIVGADYKYIIPLSMLFGSVLLVYSDILARTINPPYETPIGSLTALLGVPIFIYLVRKES